MDSIFQKQLLELIQNASLETLKEIGNLKGCKLSDLEHPKPVLSHNMVLISLAGSGLRIFFKIHFNIDEINGFVEALIRKSGPYEKHIAVDSIKELANITGGKIQSRLAPSQIKTLISIPILLRGYDEIFFLNNQEKNSFSQTWRVRGEEIGFYQSIYVETISTGLKIDESAENETIDEVEFF